MKDVIAGTDVAAEAAAISMGDTATARKQPALVAVAVSASGRQAAVIVEAASLKAVVVTRVGTVSIMGTTNTTVTTRNTREASSGGSSAGPNASLSWKPI